MDNSTIDVYQSVANPPTVDQLERLFSLRDRSAVISFLEQHPFLGPLLVEAHDHINRYFPNPRLFLDVMSDSEAPLDDHFVVYIATPLGFEAASDRLDQLDEGWWLDVLDRVQHKLSISLDFYGV